MGTWASRVLRTIIPIVIVIRGIVVVVVVVVITIRIVRMRIVITIIYVLEHGLVSSTACLRYCRL